MFWKKCQEVCFMHVRCDSTLMVKSATLLSQYAGNISTIWFLLILFETFIFNRRNTDIAHLV